MDFKNKLYLLEQPLLYFIKRKKTNFFKWHCIKSKLCPELLPSQGLSKLSTNEHYVKFAEMAYWRLTYTILKQMSHQLKTKQNMTTNKYSQNSYLQCWKCIQQTRLIQTVGKISSVPIETATIVLLQRIQGHQGPCLFYKVTLLEKHKTARLVLF